MKRGKVATVAQSLQRIRALGIGFFAVAMPVNWRVAKRIAMLGLFLAITGCQTVKKPFIGGERGPEPTELRKHAMEVLKPDSLFRRSWRSGIGEINEDTEMVMSEVIQSTWYHEVFPIKYAYDNWKYCVALVNPVKNTKDRIRVGIMTIMVQELKGRRGKNSCLWYEPTPEFKKGVEDARRRARGE